jgi:hypothetical protein
MAVSNTVDAVLRSRYEDRVGAGVQNTVRAMQSAFAVMRQSVVAKAAEITAAIAESGGALGRLFGSDGSHRSSAILCSCGTKQP